MNYQKAKISLFFLLLVLASSQIIPKIKRESSLSPKNINLNLFTKNSSLISKTVSIPKVKQPINPTQNNVESDIKGQQSYAQSGQGSILNSGYTFNETLVFGSSNQDPFGSGQQKGQDSYGNIGSGTIVNDTSYPYNSTSIFGNSNDPYPFETGYKGQSNQKVEQVTIEELKLYLALRSKIQKANIFK